MLQVNKVTKSYSNQLAVNDMSFTINEGSIFGLLGPNGAGKSSLLRMITGITQPDSGTITLNNKPVNSNDLSSLIGYMPEERGLYKKMKVQEQIVYLARLKGLSATDAKQKTTHWLNKMQMQSWAGKQVQDLSKGMSQKLQFVTTVIHQPNLLILDEPFSGLDPVNAELIKQEIYEISKQGTTIIFSTHRMEQVEEICSEIVLMHKGCNILSGKVADVKQQFKENKYELEIANGALVNNSIFNVASLADNIYSIQLLNGASSNEALNYCIKEGCQIVSFKEKLPSLNEIFIQLVASNSVTQFIS
jgi:ABC-2 type transport system ATP-binding protein